MWIVLPRYKKLLREARTYELERHDIILCTCTQSSTPSLTKTVSARQILIDECAMATEPQALIPLVCNNNPEKVSFPFNNVVLNHDQCCFLCALIHENTAEFTFVLMSRYLFSLV